VREIFGAVLSFANVGELHFVQNSEQLVHTLLSSRLCGVGFKNPTLERSLTISQTCRLSTPFHNAFRTFNRHSGAETVCCPFADILLHLRQNWQEVSWRHSQSDVLLD